METEKIKKENEFPYGSCIKINPENGEIESIVIDSWEIDHLENVPNIVRRLRRFEKEYNISCTLNSIKIGN